jgi:hypothetical protein
MQRALCLLTLLLLLASPAALAQTYKWLDENGHAQFSDRPPPPGVKFEILNSKGSPPAATAPAAGAKPAQHSSFQEQEIEFRKRRVLAAEKEKEEEKTKEEARQRLADCERWEQKVRDYQDPAPIFSVNKTGGRDYVSDADRAKDLASAQTMAKDLCAPPPRN